MSNANPGFIGDFCGFRKNDPPPDGAALIGVCKENKLYTCGSYRKDETRNWSKVETCKGYWVWDGSGNGGDECPQR